MSKRWTTEEKNTLKTLYNSKLYSYSEIAIKLNRSITSIKIKCSRYKILNSETSNQMTSLSHRKYSINDLFFSIPNPLCSYWAGFMASDGNISQKKARMTLALKTNDKHQLEKFKKDLQYTGPIKDYIYNKKDRIQYISYLTFHSYQIKKDLLKNYNLTPNKSLTLISPPNLDDTNTLAFIIGLIDGDGSIYNKKCPYGNYYAINLTGTYSICKFFKDNIDKWLNLNKGPSIFPAKKVFKIDYGGKLKSELIFKKLKSINLPRLDRKWLNV